MTLWLEGTSLNELPSPSRFDHRNGLGNATYPDHFAPKNQA
ncbi:MAG: hypothetical protein ACKO38_00475 [Planctomycetota bacterium]